ncbi:MAG: hypothetical protein J6W75_04905 [Bacteroidaceae bacterium]|nr:hypothetical protein [Prevotella sp.]MBP5360163.1 hypothetical protein [Bacteroidaceae bacterium]MBP5770683.1 hypothetical protein [Bacteroidaceae bacterium]
MKGKGKQKRAYSSIEQMQMRKEQLQEVIELEDNEIRRLWTQLTDNNKNATKGEQIGTFVSYGVMAYDGLLMLRKLKRGYGSLLNIFRR